MTATARFDAVAKGGVSSGPVTCFFDATEVTIWSGQPTTAFVVPYAWIVRPRLLELDGVIVLDGFIRSGFVELRIEAAVAAGRRTFLERWTSGRSVRAA